MTLDEFRATKREMTPDAFAEESGIDREQFEQAEAILAYAGCFFIERLADGRHFLLIERNDWIEPETTLAEMERHLFNFAKEEEAIDR